jgi:phytoene desaturase
MSSTPLRAVVVGAGLGGLAAAIRLQAQGHHVTIVERRPEIGGRAYQLRDGGYTWDMGPSLITMPWLLDELYALAGTTTAAQLTLRPLEPFYRILWAGDERHFDFVGERERMLAEMAKFDPNDALRYDDFMAQSKAIHEQGILVAGRKAFLDPLTFAKLVPTMLRLNAIRTLRGFVGQYFEDPKLRMVFDFHSLFIGGDPWRVPAIYTALSYLQVQDGVWYSDGGVYAMVESFGRLIQAGGGEIRTGVRVEAIEQTGRKVTGVRLAGGERIPADIVVSNADATMTRRRLVEPHVPDTAPWRWLRPRHTMSCYLLYLGTNREFPQLRHHTLLVGKDYPGFVRQVTRKREIADDLALYVHAPSRTERSMAANGGESLAILLPVPNLGSHDDWSVRGPELRERVLDFMERDFGLEGLRESIVVEHAWTPVDFKRDLEAPFGNAFAIEPVLWQSAYFRQPNRDRTVNGLYFVGAGTHPGGGIPGVILGAGVTTDVIAGDLASGRIRPRPDVGPRGGHGRAAGDAPAGVPADETPTDRLPVEAV